MGLPHAIMIITANTGDRGGAIKMVMSNTVSANNDTIYTSVNFSTDEDNVLIYKIDEYTIGIAIDEDDDGNYDIDTPIATSHVNGDINGDNLVTNTDLLILKKSVIGKVSNVNERADLNNDGLVNIVDLVYLKQIMLENFEDF